MKCQKGPQNCVQFLCHENIYPVEIVFRKVEELTNLVNILRVLHELFAVLEGLNNWNLTLQFKANIKAPSKPQDHPHAN